MGGLRHRVRTLFPPIHKLVHPITRKSFADQHASRAQALGNRAVRPDTYARARAGAGAQWNTVHVCAMICV